MVSVSSDLMICLVDYAIRSNSLKIMLPFKDSSEKPVSLLGSIFITVQLRSSVENIRFFVADKLATAISLGCDFHVNAIRPRLKIVRMDDLSTVPVTHQPSTRTKEVPFTEEQQFYKKKDHVSPRMNMTGIVKLQLGGQSWVEVSTEEEGTVMAEPYHPLYNNF